MSGAAEHYAAAEGCIEAALQTTTNHDETNPAAALLIAEAQVHATLAHAAVLASALRDDLPTGQVDQWVRVGVL